MVRVDARENRERILEMARQAFAEDGETSMNQIALRAGVGPGTLYRHYPTRESLVLAVYRFDVEQLVESVPELLATMPPLEALRKWATELVSAMRKKHGLGEALSPSARLSITEQTYEPVVTAITKLLDAGKDNGAIRVDADPIDFLQLTGALWRTPEDEDGRPQRMLTLILDGLQSPQHPVKAAHGPRHPRRGARPPG